MNPQQLPGPLRDHQVFDTLNGLPIHWRDKQGSVHACEGSDVHPGIRLIWTRCKRDVPAGRSYLPKPPTDDPVTCAICKAHPSAQP